MLEQFIIVVDGLGESVSGVENDVFQSEVSQPLYFFGKIQQTKLLPTKKL